MKYLCLKNVHKEIIFALLARHWKMMLYPILWSFIGLLNLKEVDWVLEMNHIRMTFDLRYGRKCKKNDKLIFKDIKIIIKHLVEIQKISFGSIQSVLTGSLWFKKVSAWRVARILTDANKKRRVEISQRNFAIILLPWTKRRSIISVRKLRAKAWLGNHYPLRPRINKFRVAK